MSLRLHKHAIIECFLGAVKENTLNGISITC